MKTKKYQKYLIKSLQTLFKETNIEIKSLDDLEGIPHIKTTEIFDDKKVIKAISKNVPLLGPRYRLRVDISINYLPNYRD